MFSVYIIYSTSRDRYYIGSTGDMEDRIYKHNNIHSGFTGTSSDWRLMYEERFETKTEARRRELEIKSWKSRKLLEKLISKGK